MDFDLKTITEMSPVPALALALNLVVWLAKKGVPIPGWSIPWICMVVGGAVYPLIADTGKFAYSMRSPLTAQIILGAVIGLSAIGTNNVLVKTAQRFGFWTDDPEPRKDLPPPTQPTGGT